MKDEQQSPDAQRSSIWPRTDWSGLGHAANAVGRDANRIGELITTYQRPLKVWLIRTFPQLTGEAGEILQEFAADRLLREGWLKKADPKRGRFRDFLKFSLKNFVMDRLRRDARRPISLEEISADPAVEACCDELFDLEWARAVLAEVIRRMELDCKSSTSPDRQRIWEIFLLRTLEPILSGQEPISYGDLVSRLNLKSPAQAQNLLATGKRVFERHFTKVIAEYQQGGEAVKAEIADLKQFVSGLSRKKPRSAAQEPPDRGV